MTSTEDATRIGSWKRQAAIPAGIVLGIFVGFGANAFMSQRELDPIEYRHAATLSQTGPESLETYRRAWRKGYLVKDDLREIRREAVEELDDPHSAEKYRFQTPTR